MRFPSKVTSYGESILVLFPFILLETSASDISPLDLLNKLRKYKSKEVTVSTYIQALDCLFALGKLEQQGGLLHYAR